MSFHHYSKTIVEEFLGSVAYVDDIIFRSELTLNTGASILNVDIRTASGRTSANIDQPQNEVQQTTTLYRTSDPTILTETFISKGIPYTLIEPTNNNDQDEKIVSTLKKSDIVILDWQMYNDRGEKATKLLISTLNECNDDVKSELKLYVIYTSDPQCEGILPGVINAELINIGITGIEIEENNLVLTFGHTKILVLKKVDTYSTDPFETQIEELADKIIEEFTNITKGLVSNFTLKAIGTLRKNTHLLLGQYNNRIDAAYLGHTTLIENKEDSTEMLISILSSSIEEILNRSKIDEVLSNKIIDNWIDENIIERDCNIEVYDEERSLPIILGTFRREKKFIKELYANYKNAFENVPEINPLKKSDKTKIKDFFEKQSSKYFSNDYSPRIDIEFARLTHHKRHFTPIDNPVLTLGTVVMKTKTTNEYWVCIQQKCDSLRIQTERRFLFLPLKIVKGDTASFDFISSDGIKLKVQFDTFNLRTVFFKPDAECHKVKATMDEDGNWYFISKHDTPDIRDRYQWVFELKDFHAQRIANNFAAQLSRVGLDESEWLRRS